MKYLFAVLGIICLLSGITVFLRLDFFPSTDKAFLFLFFSGLFFMGIFLYLDAKSEEVFSKHYIQARKKRMNGGLLISLLTGILSFLTIFYL